MNTIASRKDKRRFPRVALPCHLRYLRIPKKAEEYRNAAVQDVSQGGFRFRANELFQRRSCFLLELFIPGSNPIRSLATVAWIRTMPEDDGYQIGGTFVEPDLDLGAVLSNFVPEQ